MMRAKILLSCLATLLTLSNFAQNAVNAPQIQVSVDDLNYGYVKQNSDGTRTFKVSNIGSAPLVITNCSASCGCTVPACPKEPILPGKSADITVKYNTTGVGRFSKTVTIQSNDPRKPSVAVNIMGEVLAPATQ